MKEDPGSAELQLGTANPKPARVFIAVRWSHLDPRFDIAGGAYTERKARELADGAACAALAWRDYPYFYGSICIRAIAEATPRMSGVWYLVYEITLEEDDAIHPGISKRRGRTAKPGPASDVRPLRPPGT